MEEKYGKYSKILDRKQLTHEDKLFDGTIIVQQIPADMLDMYRQAAETTGYGLRVVADQPGQAFTLPQLYEPQYNRHGAFPTPLFEPHLTTATVSERHVAIEIEKPGDQIDHAKFWESI